MYYRGEEREAPHLHAIYGEHMVRIAIASRAPLDDTYFPPARFARAGMGAGASK